MLLCLKKKKVAVVAKIKKKYISLTYRVMTELRKNTAAVMPKIYAGC